MRFTCSKNDLQKALSAVARASASKMQKTILECVLIKCENNFITLKGTNLTTSIKTIIPATAASDGSAAVPTHMLLSLIATYPDGRITIEKVNKNNIHISCNESETDMLILDEDEFPNFPEMDEEVTASMPKQTLKSMIDETIFSIAQDEDRPIFTGLLFDVKDGSLTTVGVDGYRMAIRREPVKTGASKKCVIPGKALREAARIMDDEGDAEIIIGENMAQLKWDKTELYTRLLDGEYVNYENLVPQSFSVMAGVPYTPFKESIERASVLAREGLNNTVRIDISEGEITVSSKTGAGDKTKERIEAQTEGENLIIAFNARYILDVLKAINEENVTLKMNTPVTPCIITNNNGEKNSYTYMIMPVQTHPD